MFERVYLGPAVRERARQDRPQRDRRLFDHYVEHPELLPGGPGASDDRPARHRLHRRDDRPLLHPRLHGARSAAGVRPLGWPSGAVHERVQGARQGGGRHRRARRRAHRAAPGRPGSLRGPVPVPRGAHAVVRGRRPCRRSTTASAARRRRRRVHVRRRRPRGSTSTRRWSCSPSATGSSWSASGRTRGRGRAPAQRASGCYELLDRTAAYYERVPVGVRGGGPARDVPGRARARGGDPARVPGRLRAERLGPGAARLQRTGFTEAELFETGLVQRSEQDGRPLRPLPLADHVPARRPPRAGPRLRRRARCARSSGRST